MTIEEHFVVSSPIEQVYEALNDIGAIGHCVSGVKEVLVINENESRWKIEQRFGFIARSFNFDAQILERVSPTRISFSARAQDVKVSGHIQLSPIDDAKTGSVISMDIDVTGPLAPLVDVFAKGPQQALIQETVSNLRGALELGSTPAGAGTPERLSASMRLLAWLRGHGIGRRPR